MNKLFFLFLTLTSTLIFGQNSYRTSITVWEADTRSGGKFIGIANDQYEAEISIEELIFMNDNSNQKVINSRIYEKTILTQDKIRFEETFESDDPFITYKYFTDAELIALQYMDHQNIEAAVNFYAKLTLEKDKIQAQSHLKNLHDNYAQYLFNQYDTMNMVSYSN